MTTLFVPPTKTPVLKLLAITLPGPTVLFDDAAANATPVAPLPTLASPLTFVPIRLPSTWLSWPLMLMAAAACPSPTPVIRLRAPGTDPPISVLDDVACSAIPPLPCDQNCVP